MKLRRNIFSFRNRVVVIIVGVLLGALSIIYTNKMAQRLKEKEQHDVALWAHAMERVNRDVLGGSLNDPLVQDIMSNGNNIPFIITDENLQVLQSHLVPERILAHPDRLRRRIDRFTEEHTLPVERRPLPHHLLRTFQPAQIALLFSVRPAVSHHDFHSVGLYRVPLLETG